MSLDVMKGKALLVSVLFSLWIGAELWRARGPGPKALLSVPFAPWIEGGVNVDTLEYLFVICPSLTSLAFSSVQFRANGERNLELINTHYHRHLHQHENTDLYDLHLQDWVQSTKLISIVRGKMCLCIFVHRWALLLCLPQTEWQRKLAVKEDAIAEALRAPFLPFRRQTKVSFAQI